MWCTGSRRASFSSYGTQAQQLRLKGLFALWRVGSSQIRDQTGVSCTARRILNRWTTREAQSQAFEKRHKSRWLLVCFLFACFCLIAFLTNFLSLLSISFLTAEECSADSDLNFLIPVAVGVALGFLIIVVFISYMIGRRKSRTGYQSV